MSKACVLKRVPGGSRERLNVGITLHEADGIASACAVLAAQAAIEIILLDLSMQGVTGFEGLLAIRAQAPRVPILPEIDAEGEPLDLSLAYLRSVSPIHCEYLRNMGVALGYAVLAHARLG